jgi:hypothetical protein
VVECFELHVGGLGVDSLGRLLLLHASLDIPFGSSEQSLYYLLYI